MANSDSKFIPKNAVDVFATILATAAEHSTLGHPLDITLTRMMANDRKLFVGQPPKFSPENFKHAFFRGQPSATARDVLRSVYQGFWYSAFYKTGVRLLNFQGEPIVYEQLKKIFNPEVNDKQKTIELHALAGAIAGGMDAMVFGGAANAKTKFLLGDTTSLTNLVKTEKWNLYNGATFIGLRNSLGSASYFAAKSAFMSLYPEIKNDDVPLHINLLSNAVAGVSNALVTNPVDMLKTRVHAQRGKVSPWSIFKNTVQKEGFGALYSGIYLRLLNTTMKMSLPLALATYITKELKDKLAPYIKDDVKAAETTSQPIAKPK